MRIQLGLFLRLGLGVIGAHARLWGTRRAAQVANINRGGERSPQLPPPQPRHDGVSPILVVGSMNVDRTYEVDRVPGLGETALTLDPCTGSNGVAGGKGLNQAVAAMRLIAGTGRRPTMFVGIFGCDANNAELLHNVLATEGVDDSGCQASQQAPCGQGLVLLQPDGVSASVVVGGANAEWPDFLEGDVMASGIEARVAASSAVMLQREVPAAVNEVVARMAVRHRKVVFLDAGGSSGVISPSLLECCAFLTPNLPELECLDRAFGSSSSKSHFSDDTTFDDTVNLRSFDTDAGVVAAARRLQDKGARSVLVTMGRRGSLLVPEKGGDAPVLRCACCPLPRGYQQAVDETGAGDCFRAAFAVALVEGQPLARCLRVGAAAASFSVSRAGASPSAPTRAQCDALLLDWDRIQEATATTTAGTPLDVPIVTEVTSAPSIPGDRFTGVASWVDTVGQTIDKIDKAIDIVSPSECPWKFASRLNSMLDRPELWDGERNVAGYVARQGTVNGLDLIDFNYPQHLRRDADENRGNVGHPADESSSGGRRSNDGRLTVQEAMQSLRGVGLACGAVCLRYPKDPFRAGALTAPNPAVRRRAIDLTVEAGRAAEALGACELIIWSAFDGYDYPLQVDYFTLWDCVVKALREVCDACPGLNVSLEFKPTDENMRFFAVPSTGAALLLCRDVGRANFGLTLDVGHCFAAGENPAQSIALVAQEGKLFGIQLNDGYTRLGAEDGLVFGSVHPPQAFEVVLWLIRANFKGHVYFDSFPRNEDPVREAELNVRTVKRLWAQATALLRNASLDSVWRSHDGLGAINIAASSSASFDKPS